MRLCDLVDSSGEWNLEHIADLIPNEVKQCISRMNPPRTDDSVDTVAWTLTSDGLFSNVSAYESLLDPSLNANYNLYKIIWKWIGPAQRGAEYIFGSVPKKPFSQMKLAGTED